MGRMEIMYGFNGNTGVNFVLMMQMKLLSKKCRKYLTNMFRLKKIENYYGKRRNSLMIRLKIFLFLKNKEFEILENKKITQI